jgi:hypothetical protein
MMGEMYRGELSISRANALPHRSNTSRRPQAMWATALAEYGKDCLRFVDPVPAGLEGRGR